jgi:hypothetical protein
MRPLSKDLREFIQLLNKAKVEYLMVGAWSAAVHGYPRYTGDLDLFVRRSPENAGRLMTALTEFGFGSIGVTAEDFVKPDYVVQLGVEPNRIDLLTGISGVTFDEAWNTRAEVDLQGERVPVIGRDLLIRNKEASGRPKDLLDADALKRIPPR